MLVTRRRFLKRAALWIAAPVIVRASSLMPVSALDNEWARAMAASQELLDAIRLVPFSNDFAAPRHWDGFIEVGSSVFYPLAPPLSASHEALLDHFAKVTGLPTLEVTDGQARLSDDKKEPIRASVGKASHDRQIGSRRALILGKAEIHD